MSAPETSGASSARTMPVGRPFQPGVSGNPGGRKPMPAHLRDMARELTAEALTTAAQCMRDADAPWSARMTAVQTILDRGWGKPTQPVEINDDRPLASVPAERIIAALDALAVRVTVTAPADPDGLSERGA